jgi:hypothetical protein
MFLQESVPEEKLKNYLHLLIPLQVLLLVSNEPETLSDRSLVNSSEGYSFSQNNGAPEFSVQGVV